MFLCDASLLELKNTLERVLGGTASFWLKREALYRRQRAQLDKKTRVAPQVVGQ